MSPSSVPVVTSTSQATERLAQRVSQALRAGDVLCLVGELGSGKTTFVRGLARGLKVTQPVQSPTFQLMRIYQGRLAPGKGSVALAHLDWFRLSPAECAVVLAEEAMPSPTIYVIEWADRGRAVWPAERLEISFEWISPRVRRLTFRGVGKRWAKAAVRG